MGSDSFIDEHFEVGLISDGWIRAKVLACKTCGSFVWDTRLHMSAAHGIVEGSEVVEDAPG